MSWLSRLGGLHFVPKCCQIGAAANYGQVTSSLVPDKARKGNVRGREGATRFGMSDGNDDGPAFESLEAVHGRGPNVGRVCEEAELFDSGCPRVFVEGRSHVQPFVVQGL